MWLWITIGCAVEADDPVRAGFDSGLDCAAPGTSYADGDGDGYGSPEGALVSCDPPPPGYVLDATDCDDADPAVNPGQPEVCGDGVDNDCDGASDTCGLASASLGTARRYEGEAEGDAAGYSVSGAGDVDRDGYDDFLVAAVGHGEHGGAIYLVRGGADPASTGLAAAVRFSGEAAGDFAGESLSGAGDVDGDGYADFLVGAPNNDDVDGRAGAAYLVLGQPSPAPGSLSTATQYSGEAGSDEAGESVSGAGDVNGDGYHDVLVGAAGTGQRATLVGTAYLVLGGTAPASASLATALAYRGESTGDHAGLSTTGAGDVDGDGYDDFLVGAPFGYDDYAGCAYLVLGTALPNPGALSTAIRYAGEAAGDFAGSQVSGAGDVDGDGYADLLVGADNNGDAGTASGAAYLVLGGPAPASANLSGAFQYTGEAEYAYAAVSIAGAGDIDHDGYDDFLVGAAYQGEGGSRSGAAYLVLGAAFPASGSLATAIRYTGEAADDYAGGSVAGAGDVDDDGYGDVLVGAFGSDGAGDGAGAAFLILGQARGSAGP